MKLEGMHQRTSSRQPRRVLLRGRHHLAGLPVSEDSDDLGEELLLAPSGHSLTGITDPLSESRSGSSNIGNRVTNPSRSRRMTQIFRKLLSQSRRNADIPLTWCRPPADRVSPLECAAAVVRAVRRPIPRWRRRVGGHRDG